MPGRKYVQVADAGQTAGFVMAPQLMQAADDMLRAVAAANAAWHAGRRLRSRLRRSALHAMSVRPDRSRARRRGQAQRSRSTRPDFLSSTLTN